MALFVKTKIIISRLAHKTESHNMTYNRPTYNRKSDSEKKKEGPGYTRQKVRRKICNLYSR